MPVSVTMPRLGESVTEGTVTRWLKQVGDQVEADEPLLEVSTDKVDTEIPSPASGVLSRIVVGEDETAEVGSELAVIAGEGESPDGGGQAPAPEPSTDRAQPDGGGQPVPPTTTPSEEEAEPATPAAKAPVEPPAEPAGQVTDTGQAADGGSDRQPQPAQQPPAGGGGTAVKMPALGESVTEGTVTRWLKQVGDQVQADEPLLEVSTDKVDTEIPSPASGTLLEIKVPEDETVPVGAELAVIGTGQQAGTPARPPEQAETAAAAEPTARPQAAEPTARPQAAEPTARPQAAEPTAPAPRQPAEAAPARAADQPADGRQSDGRQSDGRVGDGEDFGGYVTPLVRKLAAEQGVDLSTVPGTGVGGRIRKHDVIEAAERKRAEAEAATRGASTTAPAPGGPAGRPSGTPAEPSPLRGRTEKMSRLRSIIANRMVESLQTSAQLTTVVEVDVTRIARLRSQAKDEFQRLHGVKLSFLPFFALATVEALRVHPNVNASIDMAAGTVTYHDAEHLGIAVDTERGLMVPVIRNAGDLNLAGLAKRIADLAERTRTMKIEPDELSGGTFTLTNTGSRGALFDTPIINQPQTGILGTGAVVKRAVVVDDPDLGEIIVPRSMAYLALSYDHRLVDGADAVRFLTTVKGRLEAGGFESELGLGG